MPQYYRNIHQRTRSPKSPRGVHKLESLGVLNAFYYDVENTPNLSGLLNSHQNIIFLFILDKNNKVKIGIENVFSQMDKLPEAREGLKIVLEQLAEMMANHQELVDAILEAIIKEIPDFNFKDKEHHNELKVFIQKILQEKTTPESRMTEQREQLFGHFVRTNEIRKIIYQFAQQGHPSLVQYGEDDNQVFPKKAFIGGEIAYKQGVWTIENKTGRYRSPTSEEDPDFISHYYDDMESLLRVEHLFREKGIDNIASKLYTKKLNPLEAKKVEFINHGIALYRREGWNLKNTIRAVLDEIQQKSLPNEVNYFKDSALISQIESKLANDEELGDVGLKFETFFPEEFRFIQEISHIHHNLNPEISPKSQIKP